MFCSTHLQLCGDEAKREIKSSGSQTPVCCAPIVLLVKIKAATMQSGAIRRVLIISTLMLDNKLGLM